MNFFSLSSLQAKNVLIPQEQRGVRQGSFPLLPPHKGRARASPGSSASPTHSNP